MHTQQQDLLSNLLIILSEFDTMKAERKGRVRAPKKHI